MTDMVLRTAVALLAALAATAADRTILAVGAHAGDMELTCGAVLARHAKAGDRVVLLHLSLGERGHPRMSPKQYGEQKRREALAAAKVLGAEVLFGPYRDGEVPNDEAARRYVAGAIRRVKPTTVITHWRHSIHKDHEATYAVVVDAVLLASLEGYETGEPLYRGVRGTLYAENWEDAEHFQPYLYVDVSEDFDRWRKAASQYEFAQGGFSGFDYLSYYDGLSHVRGAQARKRRAVAFDVAPSSKKRVLEILP